MNEPVLGSAHDAEGASVSWIERTGRPSLYLLHDPLDDDRSLINAPP